MVTPRIRAYKTPDEFLKETGKLLERREVENNLILGICNDLADPAKEHKDFVFINSLDEHGIQATSIKTIHNAVVSGVTQDPGHIKNLADYYLDNEIDLPGVVGESFYSKEFSRFYGKEEVRDISMLVHKLTSVNDLQIAEGRLESAVENDIEQITQWSMNFERDAKSFPVKNREQARKETKRKIASRRIYKWVIDGKMVSIAAIVRRTRHSGIVGLVYTPDELRGRGYATSCVKNLSEHILQIGAKYCGLFTDKANPTSNRIYRSIGYLPVAEFTAIEY